MAEWGGEAEDVVCLWASVLMRQSLEFLSVSLYPGHGLYDWALENNQEQVYSTGSCMLKPLNLGRILKAFEPQLQRRFDAFPLKPRGSFTLRVEGDSATLLLGNRLKVVAGPGKGEPLVLTRTQCARLLWGKGREGEWRERGAAGKVFDFLFPLQWHWWRSDWI